MCASNHHPRTFDASRVLFTEDSSLIMESCCDLSCPRTLLSESSIDCVSLSISGPNFSIESTVF